MTARRAKAKRPGRLIGSAIGLLEEASWALHDDLLAAGTEEVRQHPTLQARLKLKRRIDAWLRKRAADPG